jgi:hypothetical protein
MPTSSPSPSLSFDRADFGAKSVPSRVLCTDCNRDIVQSYYAIGDRIVCSDCRDRAAQPGSSGARFFRAVGASFGVAIAGSVAWWAVSTFFHIETALISIGIGYGVARAMLWGTRGRTSTMFRVLAVLITYAGISFGYVPAIATGMAEHGTIGPLHVIVAAAMSFAVPFFAGFENLLGDLIIAFGLWQAWKQSAPVPQVIGGPFSVAPAPENV